jgi:hypothetical protein
MVTASRQNSTPKLRVRLKVNPDDLSLWTPNQPNKVWHDRRPVTVFLIALKATFLSCSAVFLIALTVFRIVWQNGNSIGH